MLQQLLRNPEEVITENTESQEKNDFISLSIPYSITIHNVENGFVLDAYYALENIHRFYIATNLSDLFNIISGLWGKEEKREIEEKNKRKEE